VEYKILEKAKIISIDYEHKEKLEWETLEGLHILTDKGNIKLLISNEQSCCENWGHKFLDTPDDISNFIGGVVLKVEDTCIGLTADADGYGFDGGGETQLKVTTSKGVLQFAVYNDHNGYYSHTCFVQVFDDIMEDAI